MDHWVDGDHCIVDGVKVLDGAVVIFYRLLDR